MDLVRDEDVWAFQKLSDDERSRKPDYMDALPRYLNIFDPLFERAQDENEFEFICSLVAIRGLESAGWDAYHSTLEAVETMVQLHNKTESFVASRHLKLWIYGHVVEASQPYALVANLLGILGGERYSMDRFPDRDGRPVSPGEKIAELKQAGGAVGVDDLGVPYDEVWDRQLRNAIFHADYALHGGELRLPGLGQNRSHEEIEQLVARGNAYHDALAILRRAHMESYTEPKVIPAPGMSPDPDAQAVVIVREGDGLAGLKDPHSAAELAGGAIPWRMAILLPGHGDSPTRRGRAARRRSVIGEAAGDSGHVSVGGAGNRAAARAAS
jgi:hypothetical protein